MARVLLVVIDFMYHRLAAANVIRRIFDIVRAGKSARQIEAGDIEARRGELSQLERDRHILTGERAIAVRGIDNERIHLPRAITKTAADHNIALTTPLMRAVIAAQPRTTGALLFPSRRTGGRLKNWADLVAGLRRDSGVDFLLHDLRRTARTLMSRLGVSEDVSEMAIGHQREALIVKYNKDPMWAQRVEAFQKIDGYISALLVEAADERSNVIPLQRPVG